MSAQILKFLLVHVLLEVAECLQHGCHPGEVPLRPAGGGQAEHAANPWGNVDLGRGDQLGA